MPRQKRLNLPGAIFHVIARGNERRAIYLNKNDYEEFLNRLQKALEKSQSICYAWALMPNHFHLLIRSSEQPLSYFMRRLMTSYAGYFNRHHHRSGHLFQNRYKSILCQEDEYFLELVRYIHLNPVRAGLIKTPGELDGYPWTGHGVLVGKKKRKWQKTGEVLARFRSGKERAVSGYRRFIEDGWEMGSNPILIGGGLRRSAGGWEGVQELKKNGDYWKSDSQILGDGDFVELILKAAQEKMIEKERLKRAGWTFEKILQRGCEEAGVETQAIFRKGRNNSVSKAKSVISYWAVEKLGMSRRALAGHLKLTQQAVSKWVEKGREICERENVNLLSC